MALCFKVVLFHLQAMEETEAGKKTASRRKKNNMNTIKSDKCPILGLKTHVVELSNIFCDKWCISSVK